MSQFDQLLSYRGPLTHVNHVHRHKAEVKTGGIAYDEHGNIVGGDLASHFAEARKAESSAADNATNYLAIMAKREGLTALKDRLSALRQDRGRTKFLDEEIAWLRGEIDRATRQLAEGAHVM